METSVFPTLDIFTAPRKDSKNWTAGTISWDELRAWGDSPAGEKECGGYVLGRFKGTRRTKGDLLDRCALTLDADHPDATFLNSVRAELAGTAAIIHSTYSSTAATPRYRVIVPLARRVTGAEYAATARHLMGRIGQGFFDASCDQPERFMYRPSTQDPATFHWEPLAGGPLDVVPASETDAQDRSADSAPTPAPVAADTTPYDQLDNERKRQAYERTQDRLNGGEAKLQAALKLDEGETDENGHGWERKAANYAYMLHRLALSPWSPLDEESAKEEFHKRLPPKMAAAISGGSPLADKWRSKASGAREDGPLRAPWEEGGNTASTVTPETEPAHGDPQFERDVDTEVRRLRVQEEARKRVRADGRADSGVRTDGGAFLFDQPDELPALWGRGTDVLWARGESCMIVGPPGVGKTTITGQVVRGLLGLQEEVLGYPVQPVGKVLYLAMDRPRQIARSMARTFAQDAEHRAEISQRFIPWQGPPPEDLAQNDDVLLNMARDCGADVVVVDSLKDAAVGLVEDAVGAGYNRARQKVLAAGIEVLELHHQKKSGADGKAPKTLNDVYGSTWITAGAGSVVLLWGSAGDAVVTLHHLKQPMDTVGPLTIVHDNHAGLSTVEDKPDPVRLASAQGGITVQGYAEARFGEEPSRSDKEKARRELDSLARRGQLITREQPRESGKPIKVYEPPAPFSPVDDEDELI